MTKSQSAFVICISVQFASALAHAKDSATHIDDVDLTGAFLHSECDEMRSVALDYDPAYIEIEGEAGMFFPMPLARLVLCDVEEKAGFDAQIRLMETELELWQKQEDLRVGQVMAMQSAIEFLQSDVDILRTRLRSSESHATHWTRHPVIWFGVGVVITAAAMSLASTLL